MRSGRPLAVDDGRLHFSVHPFLFRLAAPDADATVTLNWENDEARWVAPATLRDLPAVPLLAETYERLSLSEAQAAAVATLAADRTHGAAELAGWAVEALRAEAVAAGAVGPGGAAEREGAGAEALEGLRSYGYHLACCRPSMAAVANSVAAVLVAAHEQLQSR